MIIGIDFDNTIVSYDAVFHRVAVERGVIPSGFPASKTAVRDHLRRAGQEDAWTEIQGHVYGTRMDEAEIFPGVVEFFMKCGARGIPVRIISHKTQFPYAGARHDLHREARRWLENRNFLSTAEVYFEPTKQAKLARIAATGCTHFIDDLPEFLADPKFPSGTRRILFDPQGAHETLPGIERLTSWAVIDSLIFGSSPEGGVNENVARAAAKLLAGLGLEAAGPPEPFAVGGNSRIFEVRSRDGRSFVVKSFFSSPGGGSDRFERERKFYVFAARAAPMSIPRAQGWDEAAAIGLFDRIEGRRLTAGGIGAADVAAALAFFQKLNAARAEPEARALQLAAEACFCPDEHLQAVDRRMERLGRISGDDSLDREAREFVETRLAPAWLLTRASVSRSQELGPFTRPLPTRERCVSPSDFGFHNCLRRDDGSFVFFDFEHAGWDDPAKTVCDFFSQPEIPVSREYFDRFAAEVAGMLGGRDASPFVARCRALAPVYRLKWCCIMLNEFCRDERDRRAFALGTAAFEERKKRQLEAARSALADLSETIKN